MTGVGPKMIASVFHQCRRCCFWEYECRERFRSRCARYESPLPGDYNNYCTKDEDRENTLNTVTREVAASIHRRSGYKMRDL